MKVMRKYNKNIVLALGILLFILGMVLIFAPPMTFSQYWPAIVIYCGIAILPIGWLHFKKLRLFYVFPSLSLTILGVFFLLFTLKIIKVPMSVFFKNFLPFFLLLSGAFLIVLYYVRLNAKDKIPLIKEEEKYADYDDYYNEDDD